MWAKMGMMERESIKMDAKPENVFSVCLTLVVLCLILSSLSYCQNNDRLIAEALKNGQDPLLVNCAFKANLNNLNLQACQNVRK